MRKVPRLGANKYFIAASVYMTPRKAYNMFHCGMERRQRITHPKSKPYIVILDVTNVCNLRCPFCPTGAFQKSGRKPSMMTAEFVSHVMDHLADTAVICYLYNWGEPLLNPEIEDIIRVIHDRGVFTSLSTNLSIDLDDRLEGLVDAGLDHMDPSIDGATQEIYEVYRKKGKIDLVYKNIRRLLAHRKKTGRLNPIIDWQYLRFQHNAHEIDVARKTAKELGVDRFFTRHGSTPDDKASDQTSGRDAPKHFACSLLWRSLVINADGGVAPCCYMYRKDNDFDHIENGSPLELRQGETFVTARLLFDERRSGELPVDLNHPCLTCSVTQKKPHLAELIARNEARLEAATRETEEKSDGFFYRL